MSFPNFRVFLKIENSTSAFLIQDSCFFLGLGVSQGFLGGRELHVCVFRIEFVLGGVI